MVLEQLIKERDDLIKMGCSLEVAAVNDRTIIAVQQVIDAYEFNLDNLIYLPSEKIQSPYSEIKRFIDFVKQLSELNEDIRFHENYWKKVK